MMTRRALLAGLSAAPWWAAATSSVAAAESTGGRRGFPNVPLVTQQGRHVRFYDDLVRGKNVVFSFFYTECEGICPAATANLVKVQALLGDRVGHSIFMYSISLKPRQDTPRAMAAYA